MRFTPNHTVSYHGKFYAAGEPFEIEPADVEEMQRYGIVENIPEPVEGEPPKRSRKKE